MITAEAPRLDRGLPAWRALVFVIASGALAAFLGMAAGYIAFRYFNVRQSWQNPPVLSAWLLSAGAAGGLAGLVLCLPARRLPLSAGALFAVVLVAAAVLLPVPVGVWMGHSLIGACGRKACARWRRR